MPKPAPRELQVIGSRQITPNMLRVTLGGEGLHGFPEDQESAYVKLLFNQGEGQRPLMRTYTIRHQRESEIDIDFALHEHPGPASAWAMQAKPGDKILVGGPGARKLIHPEGDWFLLVGDMTALPAISVNLELLPQNARGHAIIEITSEEDRQPLQCPPGVEIHWVVCRDINVPGGQLLSEIRALAWPEGRAAVWCACEFSTMRQLRDLFRNERPIEPSMRYISSYWKFGLSEDQHKQVKREDEETAALD
ncbi:siderophore-interacting protein [Microbulbifer sp. SH-1]|uniref:siderophore-interacting protein n=1 Tax=Microbulbifer sp. SH-1 TaxID=2681547 RepID=UPI00140E41D8|nr:siderophore-interacting protein [Microbulbifer sp. SH-1]QIL89061.1 siderophore-interacting protein [Microbulbifer sp. SH-1]